MTRRILLANPRGFCAGVERAIRIIEELLEIHPDAPLYVRKEIVHNRDVVEKLRARGVIFVEELDEVPEGALVVFSAHGVAKAVQRHAKERNLRVLDATCPLVSKVHVEAMRFNREGYFLLFIGHDGHDEVAGTLGQVNGGIALVESIADAEAVAPPDPERVALITQTTLSLDDTLAIVDVLKRRFPAMREPQRSDICYATQNRQNAVHGLAEHADVVIVVGSSNSSNSVRLMDCSLDKDTPAYLLDDPAMLDAAWFEGAATIGVTAGASTPEQLVLRVVARISELTGVETVEEFGQPEPPIVFRLPRELDRAV
ncbi:MAG TPA: 4-hydroxy-3-methylbut-2-enyl diphosphate reductase [Candidatus Baltobacteraceae bacterium]|jgi:4-hydroxy-3-methylbut-2-enyl diphosphate reductase